MPNGFGTAGFYPPLAFILFLVLILIFWGLGDGAGWW